MTFVYDPRMMRRLVRDSGLAWTAITAALTLYVLRTYASDGGMWAVVGRQAANWMPFALVLPALYAAVCRFRPRTSGAMRGLSWVATYLATVVGYGIVRFVALQLVVALGGSPPEPFLEGVVRMLPIATIVHGALLAILMGVFARIGREEAESRARALEVELTAGRLRALQAQIRPHFLFNTLQAIEDACWRSPEQASTMVLQLSELLRASLEDEQRPHRGLGDDLKLARKYIALQQARFGSRLRFEEDIDESLLGQPVPTLFLQPLLENAITHGIESLPDGGVVQFSAKREGTSCVLRIVNDGPVRSGGPSVGSNDLGGIGFANTADRLRSLYGPNAELSLTWLDGGGACVEARVEATP
tara:strand:+ start:3323 stop:4402 length:1080 start_codon:yes stop_codon:yes gene_type:complete